MVITVMPLTRGHTIRSKATLGQLGRILVTCNGKLTKTGITLELDIKPKVKHGYDGSIISDNIFSVIKHYNMFQIDR